MEIKKNNLLKYFSYEDLVEISKIDDLYLKAKIIVTELFKDKVDKEGKPYIGHLLRVSDRLDNYLEKVAGLLHDTVEDIGITFEDLINIGFPSEIIDIVRLVTKEKIDKTGLTDDERLLIYYKEIDNIINSGNIHAINLKYADMSDNYDLNRLNNLPLDKQEWFHKKYGTQLEKLRKYIKNT